ncbi:S-layer homology domain-containing protein [Paenibacillus sp. NPDC058071]|uniref:S-layer homology domain-containing protein n=1 Tax=Paenibacillus sp. NPDC058071 TaxID=3346326 RepID=UPI0036DF7675
MRKQWLSLSLVLALVTGTAVGPAGAVTAAEPASGSDIVYVRASAKGANDGTSWKDAYRGLDEALTQTPENSGKEIWVAKGTYYPSGNGEDGASDKYFAMKNGIAIRGGFAGNEQAGNAAEARTVLERRNFAANETVLSGDTDRGRDRDARSVIVNDGINSSAVLDGFTVSGGSGAGGRGEEGTDGGGIRNTNSSPTLVNLIVKNNTAAVGGGISNWNSSPTITNVTFTDNQAAGVGGGAVANRSNSHPIITNAVFTGGNSAQRGGALYNEGSSPILTNVSISGNRASVSGGGIYNASGSKPQLRNSIVYGNNDPARLDIANVDGGTVDIYFSIVKGVAAAGQLNGVGNSVEGNLDADPNWSRDLRLRKESPAVDRGSNRFYEQGASPDLSAISTDRAGKPRFSGGQVDLGAYESEFAAQTGVSIELTADPAGPTQGPVQVKAVVKADGPGNGVSVLKWAEGQRNAAYFRKEGADITSAGQATIAKNGTYTFYVQDKAGNEAVKTIAISTIWSDRPVIQLTPGTTGAARSVDIKVSVSLQGNGNELAALKWADGGRDEAFFDTRGAAVPNGGFFTVTENGVYTVYARDKAGNEAVKTIEITNITKGQPVINVAISPANGTAQTVEVTVAAEAQGAGNKIVQLKWAEGNRNAAYFDNRGASLANGGKFNVTENGVYTLYARDSAGGETVRTIEITNVAKRPPVIAASISPQGGTTGPVEVTVRVDVKEPGAELSRLRWSEGTRDTAYFAANGNAITNNTFKVAKNGIYTVYARDTAGNEAVATVTVSNILAGLPVIRASITPPTETTGSVQVTVTTVVQGTGNNLAKLKWENGTRAVDYFNSNGSDITSASKFTVGANGLYTIYAKDTAGNAAVLTIQVSNIVTPKPWCESPRFIVRKGQSASLKDTGMTIDVPWDATDSDICFKAGKTTTPFNSQGSGDRILSSYYHFSAEYDYSFKKSLTLTVAYDGYLLGSNQIPSLYSYDLNRSQWTEVGGTADGRNIVIQLSGVKATGTVFAVFARSAVKPEPPKPEPPKPGGVSFTDINGHWAASGIREAARKGIVNGDPDGRFRPNASITRAEFIVMVMNALDDGKVERDLYFSDEAKIGSWARASIAEAVRRGFANGYEDGSFRPNATITRAEIAAIVGRVIGIPDNRYSQTGFADDRSIPKWAKGAVETLRRQGVLSGRSGNKFEPQAKATRAEAVVIVLQSLKL